jgi:hypothetical protein
VARQGLDDAAADRVIADDRERTDRNRAAELVAHHREHARDLLAARRPGGRIGRVRVHDAVDIGHVPVDIGVRGRVGRRIAGSFEQVAVEVADDHRLRIELVIADTRGLDHEDVVEVSRAGDALGDVARRPRDEIPARKLGVQVGDAPLRGVDGGPHGAG